MRINRRDRFAARDIQDCLFCAWLSWKRLKGGRWNFKHPTVASMRLFGREAGKKFGSLAARAARINKLLINKNKERAADYKQNSRVAKRTLWLAGLPRQEGSHLRSS